MIEPIFDERTLGTIRQAMRVVKGLESIQRPIDSFAVWTVVLYLTKLLKEKEHYQFHLN